MPDRRHQLSLQRLKQCIVGRLGSKVPASDHTNAITFLVHRGLLHRSWNQTRLVLIVSVVLMVSVVLVELVRLSGAATISLPPTPPPAPIFSALTALQFNYPIHQLSEGREFFHNNFCIKFFYLYSCSVSLSCNFLKAFFMLWSVLTRGMSYLLQLGLLASPRSPTITFAAKISAYHPLIK